MRKRKQVTFEVDEGGGAVHSAHSMVTLTKHHGCENDFLVIVDSTGVRPLDPSFVVAVCDRHRGVGADGVIRVTGPESERATQAGTDLAMELRNADGSLAEMSGNGIRALAQAAVRASLVDPTRTSFTVATDGGVRTLEFSGGDHPGRDWASVDMGVAAVGVTRTVGPHEWPATEVDVGNPHLVVLVDDPSSVDVAGLGAALQAEYPAGINVEFVSLEPSARRIVLRVFERGAGETRACGTGSCAAVAAAQAWGLHASEVEVVNPGGPVVVSTTDQSGGVRLAGPVVFVGEVTVDVDALKGVSGA